MTEKGGTVGKVDEPVDIIAQARGREKFLRDRCEIKSPEIIAALIEEIERTRAEVERLTLGGLARR